MTARRDRLALPRAGIRPRGPDGRGIHHPGLRSPRLRGAAVLFAAPLLAPALAAAQPAGLAPPPQPGVIERVAPPAEPPRLGPRILPPEPERATGPGEERSVTLRQVRVEGAEAIPAAELRAVLDPLAGREATLAEIEEARLSVVRLYRARGLPYTAALARLAPVRAGAREADLVVTVVEGHVAEVRLDGDIGPAARQVLRFLDPLVGQKPLSAAALERALLLVTDIPGVTATSVLRPIAGDPGALRLIVQLRRQVVSGFYSVDNRGYQLTGRWQHLLVGQVNALTALGERTEISALQTDGNGQTFIQASEEVFLGGSGLRLRLYAGWGRAAPGSPLAAIGYAGETRVAGAALTYPIIRSRPLNLAVSGQFDAFESEVEARPAPGMARERTSLDSVRTLRIGLDGSVQDALLGFAPAAAVTYGSVRLHQGIEALGASSGRPGRVARAGSDFGFTKLTAEATRVQPLFVPAPDWIVGVQATLAGQWTDSVLPPVEKFYLGGNRLGRGFYAGQVTGDRAVAYSIELQASTGIDVPVPAGWLAARMGEAVRTGLQLYVFHDQGWTFESRAGDPDRRVASWGGGLRTQLAERLQWEIEGVQRLTRRPEGAGIRPVDAAAVFTRILLRL